MQKLLTVVVAITLIGGAVSVDAAEKSGSALAPFCGSGDQRCAHAPNAISDRAAQRRERRPDANGNPILITVTTAAGIDITVAPHFAAPMQSFIADIVAAGYRPSRIKCFSLSDTHVPRSRHFTGEACDFNQHGWNKTDRFMYRVHAIAAKHGLRDGCSFGDCGHIDVGLGTARSRMPHVAELPTREQQP